MNTKKTILTGLLAILCYCGLFAQSAKIKKAKQYMDDLNYQQAIQLYNEILEKNDDSEAKINIATCYRKINDPENAEYWYGQVVRLPEAEPQHKLYYGMMLQRNGKCDLAKEWYEKYIADVPDDMRGQYLVKACDYEDELRTKNAGIYEVMHMEFNSNLDDFSPAYYGDGLVFASERDKGVAVKRTSAWTGNPFLELYYLDAKPVKGEECGNFIYGRPDKFSQDLNTKYHDAAVSFSGDQKQIFFTRNNYQDGKTGKSDEGIVKLKVYSATVKGKGEVTDLAGLPFNSDEYSVAHPSLTSDGKKIFFSSDMPGGFGGMDLYVSEKDGNNWGPPLNLGPGINTEGNEIFPYYHATKRLYFSSDGQIGLGGYDIYFMEDKGDDQWSAIENIGYPINTIADDFSIILNEEGTCGYFASDREGGVGRDDIYSFRKTASPVQILVYDKETKEPIEGASVLNDCTGNTLTTAADGTVTIDMKMDQCCIFTASMETYLDNAEKGCTKDIKFGEPVFVEIPMSKEITFAMEGAVFDAITDLPLEGVSLVLTNDCSGEEQTFMTDDTGVYSFKLDKDCCYTLTGEKEDYFTAQVGDQCTRGLTESFTLAVNLNLQPYKVDQNVVIGTSTQDPETIGEPIDQNNTGDPAKLSERTGQNKQNDISPTPPTDGAVAYLLHIYYDFDQAYIRDEAEPVLNDLKELLELNPTLVVEIGSHTDSRGSFRYNRRLSQRRAESVVRWLTRNGIERDRLVPVGYGENKNVNNCKNYIPCSEKEHQMNRRTEFRVIGKKGDMDFIQESKANPNARVDVCAGCPF